MSTILQKVKSYLPLNDIHHKQTANIIFITFWSQFAVYCFYTILILFLTKPLVAHGLGYNQAQAYAFIGVAQAMGYLMPTLGGHMADNVVGIRRSILIGSITLACVYLLVVLSGFTVSTMGDTLFIAAYALVPAANSLLMGTASSLVSHIYADDAIKAKSAMTFYYMAINVGGIFAAIIAPILFDSPYGPLSVLAVVFVGKTISALNFAYRYKLYDTIIWGKDKLAFGLKGIGKLVLYILAIYALTLYAYTHVFISSILITIGCSLGILWFLFKTFKLKGLARSKQIIAIVLTLEAVVYFIIYNQMNTTLVLFAKNNSDRNLLGFIVSPAQYQMLNPILVLLIGLQLPRFYRAFPKFTIPYQFAAGTLLAGLALLIMVFAAATANAGIINGNYIALTYILISLAELWVSAIGLSMIGLYCDLKDIALAMGIWYLASSMSNAISGRIAAWVAIPETVTSAVESLAYYKDYYFSLGVCTLALGLLMAFIAYFIQKIMAKRGLILN